MSGAFCRRAQPALDLAPRPVAERGDETAGRADQRRKAAPNVHVEPERHLRARQRHYDHVLEAVDLDADRGDAPLGRDPVEHRLDQAGNGCLRSRSARGTACRSQGCSASSRPPSPLLDHQHAQDMQAGARHHPERLRDRLDAERLRVASEQPQDRDRAAHRGHRAHAPGRASRGRGRPAGEREAEAAFVLDNSKLYLTTVVVRRIVRNTFSCAAPRWPG